MSDKKISLPPVKTYGLMSDAIERGVSWGLARAHKHTEAPTRQIVEECIHDAIMLELAEVFDFDDDEDES